MIILLSPAKTLDFSPINLPLSLSEQVFIEQARSIVSVMKRKRPEELMKLMDISTALAQLNADRYNKWTGEDASLMKAAVLAFRGEVYTGLNADSFTADDLEFAQNHLRILSGLYGWLRPLDNIEAYRLEMGTRLKVGKNADLYGFWRSRLTRQLMVEIIQQNTKSVVNLASNEYFSVLEGKSIKAEIVSPVFKDFSKGQYKIVSFFAKKARGLMASYIIRNRITSHEDLIGFSEDGYHYNATLSEPLKPVFTRG
jgi:uncharacterized protein